ncbi:MAG TPA: vanadium-dependent haloperoxidase [Candidatus Dormibacteraeota bacterium]
MRRKVLLWMLAAVVALTGAVGASGSRIVTVRAAEKSNVVIDWNRIMLTAFATPVPPVPAPPGTRLGAIVQAAVFDAVNGIDRKYTPIHVAPAAPDGASPEAAAAGAAHTVLVAMFPAQQAALDADLAASLAAMKGSNTGIANGLAWGNSVGAQIWAWRKTDGFSTVLPAYVPGTAPGDWQPTPGGSGDPKFRTLAITTPFAMTSPSQFRPAGPPALTSALYLQDFNEVKAFGNLTSTVRTPYQTQTGQFWQSDTVTAIWDRVADTLAEEHHYNLLRSARLLAFVDVALADAAIAVWDAKNTFNFWRPITAIGDPSWVPLLTTPYFQEYPSGHSGASSAAATVLASFFGNETDFTLTSNALPGVTRSFTSFSDAVAQVADARVFAGFHFRFSCNDAAGVGIQVANHAESTLMQRTDGENERSDTSDS